MQLFISRKRTRPLVLLAALTVTTFVLSACGGGGGDGGSGAAAATPGGNASIASATSQAALQDKLYTYTPVLSAPSSGARSFSITGMPAWATFNSATGELRGTPSAADIGLHKNISISVTDGTTTTVLTTFDIEVVAAGAAHGAVTVSWTAPIRNADGTPLTDLAGFKIYWGTSQGNYSDSVTIDDPGTTTYVVDQLLPATYYFVVRAVNQDGVESNNSKEGSKTIG